MEPSPLEYAESLYIGTVEFVSPDEIKVSLDIEAPEFVALNTGTPRPFPRVNSYVLIPSDEGYMVGQVEWLTIERSAYPKRRGMQDFGLVDLPYPLRKMSLNPLGTLRKTVDSDGEENYRFRRGADAFPSVGDGVLLPTQNQLRSIVESGDNRWVKIGTSPLAGNASVCVDPDRLFGRHLAVLGNTGSGKSCSVAGLIRWSLEAAQQRKNPPNARFIVLDPNGEYARAFGNDTDVLKPRLFKVNLNENEMPLQVPLWFWNSAEWSSFAQASGKTQRPLLRRALREVRAGRTDILEGREEEKKLGLRRYLSSNLISIRRDFKSGAIKTEESKFGFRLKAINTDLDSKSVEFPELSPYLNEIREKIKAALSATFQTFEKNGKTIEYYRSFTELQVTEIIKSISVLLNCLGGIIYQEGPSEDVPISFTGTEFCDHLQILSEEEGVTQYLDFLVMRIRTILSDTRMKSIISDAGNVSLDQWLTDYVGDDQAVNGCLTIIDLSLVPSEIIHIITAVIARMIFESLQRYRKLHKEHKILPTVLVMEEAHTFIKRYNVNTENQDAASVCCQVFERIAREGRKFGLGLVLSSQRPYELSPTVLSQCNTFLLHRISNDQDQELVHRFVPDNLKGLLRELPSLPSQNAILLGWASELPVLVRMNDLPEEQQPQSDDPDFWDVWTGEEKRETNWRQITDDWQEKTKTK
jgi:Helicase HerA, central domain